MSSSWTILTAFTGTSLANSTAAAAPGHAPGVGNKCWTSAAREPWERLCLPAVSALAAPTTQDVPQVAPGAAPKVLVGMSGGVDASVAATLHAKQGYDVVGGVLRFWPDHRPEGAFVDCCSADDAYDARHVTDELDVPIYLLDFRDRFQEIVIDPPVPGYVAGSTPNPCVWCNREIKVGALVQRAPALGFEDQSPVRCLRRPVGPTTPSLHSALVSATVQVGQ